MDAPGQADERWATDLECSWTGERAPLDRPTFVSPAGKPWLVRYALDRDRGWLGAAVETGTRLHSSSCAAIGMRTMKLLP